MTSVLQPVRLAVTQAQDVTLYLKRDDLLHPMYGGNKIRKLKYNVEACLHQGKTGLLTCGGAFSNHIIATAAYGKEKGLKTKAVIRGEELTAENPTLREAASLGMEFIFVNREMYKSLRERPSEVYAISNSNEADYYFIPEGGTNTLAIQGVAELIAEIEIPFDYIAVPAGTGGTFAGLMKGLTGRKEKLLIFSALKNGDYLKEEMNVLLKEDYDESRIELFTSAYSFGGYGKMKPELKEFADTFQDQTGILLDPIYNGKMMYGLVKMIEEGFFKKGSVIVAVHTGGVQAWRGYKDKGGIA